MKLDGGLSRLYSVDDDNSAVASKLLKVNPRMTEEDLQMRVSLLLLQRIASLMVAGIIHAYRTDK